MVVAIQIPGWVDLQVNGFKGMDFSDINLTKEGVVFVSKELLKKGTIAYCPTIITSPLEIYERNLPIIAKAAESKEGAQIIGIHLEGPFLSPDDGYRGFHPKKWIIPPSIELFKKFQMWSKDRIVIITLDPSREQAIDLIKHVVKNTKITVSIGHHNSNAETIKTAVDTGVRAATHVGNGIAKVIHRFDNPIWPILAEDRLTGLFITDGFHLPKEMIKTCLRAKKVKRFIVTSDLVHYAGMKPGEYMFHDGPVVLEPSGYLHRKGETQLAGSTSTMIECMNHLASLDELNEKELYNVGYCNPLKLLGVKVDQERLNLGLKITCMDNKFQIIFE